VSIKAANWWHSLGDTFDKICREFITRALKAEQDEKGHECGHRFEITVRSSTHLSGPGDHKDADYYDGCVPVEVRAHNLRDALLVAASLPLSDWFEADGALQTDDEDGHDVEAAIPPVVLDPRHARDCICDPRHLEIGGYDNNCPRHDQNSSHV